MSETLEAQVPAMAPVKGGLVTYLAVDGAVRAAELYRKAFGAEIAAIHPPDDQGRTMHIHLYVNGSSLMMGDFYPEQGHAKEVPAAFNLTLQVDDANAWFQRAVDAGCDGFMPPQKMFWGDTWGQLRDPFGITWAINSPAER